MSEHANDDHGSYVVRRGEDYLTGTFHAAEGRLEMSWTSSEGWAYIYSTLESAEVARAAMADDGDAGARVERYGA